MKSYLYKCSIFHDRSRPEKHSFNYNLFYFCIDLDDLSNLFRNPLISSNKTAFYSLLVSDHVDCGKISIKANLISYLENEGISEPIGKVQLFTQLRIFGHLFNPVSFYFVYNLENKPLCIVAEVANTFNEQKLYLLNNGIKDTFRDEKLKEFYISPFSDLQTHLHFKIKFPSENLTIQINQSDSSGIYFRSGIRGRRSELSTISLLKQTLRFPLSTVQIVVAIHWHALLLYIKKIPVRKKSSNLNLQKNLRPYLSRSSALINHKLI